MIYRAKSDFRDLLEKAGLRSSQLARDVEIQPTSLLHIMAGRRNMSGAIAARIARKYAAATGIDQDAATAARFDFVAEKKNTGNQAGRGENRRFTKE